MTTKRSTDNIDLVELEFWELQEGSEIEDLVCKVREEVQRGGNGHSCPSAGPSSDPELDSNGFVVRATERPPGLIHPLPNTREPSPTADRLGVSRRTEDLPLKDYFRAVVERLSRLEKQLEEQRGLLERTVSSSSADSGQTLPSPRTATKRIQKKAADAGVADFVTLQQWSRQNGRNSRRNTQAQEDGWADGSRSKQNSVTLQGVPEHSTEGFDGEEKRRVTGAHAAEDNWASTVEDTGSDSGTPSVNNAAERPVSETSATRGWSGLSFLQDNVVAPSVRLRNSALAHFMPVDGQDKSHRDSSKFKPEAENEAQPDDEKGNGEEHPPQHPHPDPLLEHRKTQLEKAKAADKARNEKEQKVNKFGTASSTIGTEGKQGLLMQIVSASAFDYFFASMIIMNSLFIGVQTEYRARALNGIVRLDDEEGLKEPKAFEVVEQVFAILFAIELAMRMGALKAAFFEPKVRAWNMFDMLLVTMSAVELILNATAETGGGGGAADPGSTAGKVIRMFRMARIVRIMRVVRFLAELRIMVTLIGNSARSLFWLMILLLGILYIFSIFFTQGVTDYLDSALELTDTERTTRELLKSDYGNMFHSAYTLFASITGGVSWRDVLNPLGSAGWGFSALFIMYVFFCIFSVLNIVTGVFVDGAIQRSSQERDLRLEKEKETRKQYESMLRDLLNDIDKEGTGAISREALEDAFRRDEVKHYFQVLEMDVEDSDYLFDMLDLDRSGEVDVDEFVNGCLRLKGHAKSIDIHTLMYEIKIMIKQMNFFMEYFVQESKKAQ